MKIFCKKNNGYRWTELPGGCFKGYIQPPGCPEPLRGEEALRHFARAESFEGFLDLLKGLDGLYAVVLRREDGGVWAAVDTVRSMPLYYSVDGSYISDSGPAVREALGIPKEEADLTALEELFYTGCVAGPRTTYAAIAQLDAAQALECAGDGALRAAYYYSHSQKTIGVSRDSALRMFQEASEAAFDEEIAAIGGRPVVISLSGGYDSRYVACMLKARGVEDVSCYTYGRKDSFEVRDSERIAKALGWRWIFVEYTDERMRGLLTDPVGQQFCKACETYDYYVFPQNFAAVKYLHETGWIKPGSVFLSGLCCELAPGHYSSYTRKDYLGRFSPEDLGPAVSENGALNRLSGPARKAYLEVVDRQRRGMGLPLDTYEDFSDAVDALSLLRRHGRRAMHMNDAHGFFGYEWLLPGRNRRLLDFWYSMPVEYKLNKNLYIEWFMKDLFARYGLNQEKGDFGYDTFQGWEKTKARLRLLLNRIVCLPLGITLRQPQDYTNYAPLITLAFRRLRQKHLISLRLTQMQSIVALYFMEQTYGPRCLKNKGKT